MMCHTEYLPEWFMNRYRGRRGFLGWLVLRADAWWLSYAARIAVELDLQHKP